MDDETMMARHIKQLLGMGFEVTVKKSTYPSPTYVAKAHRWQGEENAWAPDRYCAATMDTPERAIAGLVGHLGVTKMNELAEELCNAYSDHFARPFKPLRWDGHSEANREGWRAVANKAIAALEKKEG